MPSGPASAKSKRRYGNIKESIKKQGKSDALADQLAEQTIDRRRTPRHESESPREEAGMGDARRSAAPAPEHPHDASYRRKR